MDRKNLLHQLGRQIQLHRKQLGITQEEFANKLSIDRSYMGRIEQGRINLSFIKLYELSIALEIDLSTLLKEIDYSKEREPF